MLAIPAIASSIPALILRFRGSGTKQTLEVHTPGPSGGTSTSFQIRVDATSMREYMARISEPPVNPDERLVQIARDLYDQIWKPIRKVPISYRGVYVCAEDDFEQFAFEALCGGRQWIGRAAAVHYLKKGTAPSAAFRRPLKTDRPSYSYAPFPERGHGIVWTGRESRLVAKFTGAESREGSRATKSQLLADISRPFGILHVATHGLEVDGDPDIGGIALHRVDPASEGEDWFDTLRPEHLDSVRVDGRLVVLSACAPNPAAIQALSTRFIERGAGEVISNRFAALDDAAAFAFMHRFYEEIRGGANSGTALLRARSVMIDGGYPAYKHPFFWAGFRSSI